MRDENVDPVGQSAPDLLVVLLALEVLEGSPRVMFGVGRAEYLEPIDLDHLMLEVDAALAELGQDGFPIELRGIILTLQGYFSWMRCLWTADSVLLSRAI